MTHNHTTTILGGYERQRTHVSNHMEESLRSGFCYAFDPPTEEHIKAQYVFADIPSNLNSIDVNPLYF